MTETNLSDAIRTQNEKLREIEERLARIERGQTQHAPGLTDILDRLIPADVREHLRAARREQLLAARALVDDVLERIDDGATRGSKRRRIEVE